MMMLTALKLLFHADRPATSRLADDGGAVSAPALALVVAVLVLVIGIVVTGSHQIVMDAIGSALDAATGG